MKGLVDSALAGFNIAVCAYDQSGAVGLVKLGGNATRCSIMNLVDLAGSENAAASGTQGLRQKEDVNINRSLLALYKVVFSLAKFFMKLKPRNIVMSLILEFIRSRKARRRISAPWSGLPSLTGIGSLPPPCKRERNLRTIEKCGLQTSVCESAF
ncbi:hypothetical protein GCK32_004740 [Trichostrongylus colubriformis]|uniref:Kinesin motor domain-containing protein n=1 Tax=Trichostrongylus colubriformis TaxID=6319 RepID=A0AAN8FWI9_TRICO